MRSPLERPGARQRDDRIFDLFDDGQPRSARERLDHARISLAATATHSGTWHWEAATDSFVASPSLLQAVPGLDLSAARAALVDGPAGDYLPPNVARSLPGDLARALALAAPGDRLPLALSLASAWTHRAGFELNHRCGPGERPTTVRHVAATVISPEGEPLGLVGAVTVLPESDISDPHGDAETAHRHRHLVDVLPDGVLVHQDGVVVDANPALLTLLGLTDPAELIGTPILGWVVPEGRRRVVERLIAMSRPGATAPPEEEVLLRPDGRTVPVEIVSIRTTWRGRPAAQAVITDIRERQAILQRLRDEATHDDLTGLGNRRLIIEEIRRRLGGGLPFGVLFVDLDKFKDVNDSYGYVVGDLLLRQTVSRLITVVGDLPGSFVGRLSGDEFLLLVPPGCDAEQAAVRVHDALQETYRIRSWDLVVTAGVGVVHVDPHMYDTAEPQDLIRDGHVALQQAKRRGRGQSVVFDQTMRQSLQRRVVVTDYLRRAVEAPQESGIRLFYQPLIRARDDRVHAVETLVRWDDPALGPVYPDEFIPLAEDSGLIVPLGEWILLNACRQVAGWRRSRPELADLTVAVNLSPRQFSDESLVQTVRTVLEQVDLPAEALCLEITETALADDVAAATAVVSELHGLGVHLSIDDFGTGYSSLAYLRNLPVSELKVDRSFVSGIGERVRDETICASVISMAHLLGLKVVAEGVETREQSEHLKALGCDFLQGFFTSRPLPPEEALAFLLRQQARSSH